MAQGRCNTTGLIDQVETMSLQESADLIFYTGLSTANEVSDVSGRGVGMDAVRSFLHREKGDIRIHLIDENHPQSGCYPFYFEIVLPNHLFATESIEDLRLSA